MPETEQALQEQEPQESPETNYDLLGPRYDHRELEGRIYARWERSGYFDPDKLPGGKGARGAKKKSASRAKPFSVIMPPPNANGSLHLGHAVFVTLQDVMTRHARMKGERALWLPGADHAGFETQVVFDKKLDKEGRNRFAMDREELWQAIWSFTQENKKHMESQLRKLGASCDWSREKFTLDPDIVKIVCDTFERLYKDKLVYRDLKVVNWCPKHRTALSDLEVNYVERTDPLYYINYGPVTLATVRPETKFGDTAIAVNPRDERYRPLVGKEIEAEGVLGPVKLKVIADEAVDASFGTGAVKVTPAHDSADFDIWQRHKNEIPGPKIVIDEAGRLTSLAGPFKGLKAGEARAKVAEAMQAKGLLKKVEPNYTHQVATCYKCNSILEPLPKPQWFVKTKPLAFDAVKAAKTGKIEFSPDHAKKVYLHWLENIRDWNISRQIVWGIRIPAWFCVGCGTPKINMRVKSRWFLVRHGETEWNKANRTREQTHDPLSEAGIAQAEKTAASLKDKHIDLIITSDLARARHTADIIREATGAELVADPALRERHFGITQGMQKEARDRLYGDLLYGYEDAPPGGESFRDVEERAWRAFASHRKRHAHRNVAIVTHGGPIRTILKRLKDWTHEEMLAHYTENAAAIELDLGDMCDVCHGDLYEQDPDVFDTWFSSGQWPFAALMAGAKGDFEAFYPTSVLDTAQDILFFWVARMAMLGLYRTGQVPFRRVYLHGLVRDKDRQKMSKSKGNVVDPLGVAELYGTDALRMALVAGNTAGNDILISEEKVRGYRNFATKLWNIARFILMHKAACAALPAAHAPKLSLADKKAIAEAKEVKREVGRHIERLEFHLAVEKAYHYVWHTFADKVVESAKPRLKGKNLDRRRAAARMLEAILLESLTMLHPVMPFITEAIYERAAPDTGLLLVKPW